MAPGSSIVQGRVTKNKLEPFKGLSSSFPGKAPAVGASCGDRAEGALLGIASSWDSSRELRLCLPSGQATARPSQGSGTHIWTGVLGRTGLAWLLDRPLIR